MRIKEYKGRSGERFCLDLNQIAAVREVKDANGIEAGIMLKGAGFYATTSIPYEQLLKDWKGEE